MSPQTRARTRLCSSGRARDPATHHLHRRRPGPSSHPLWRVTAKPPNGSACVPGARPEQSRVSHAASLLCSSAPCRTQDDPLPPLAPTSRGPSPPLALLHTPGPPCGGLCLEFLCPRGLRGRVLSCSGSLLVWPAGPRSSPPFKRRRERGLVCSPLHRSMAAADAVPATLWQTPRGPRQLLGGWMASPSPGTAFSLGQRPLSQVHGLTLEMDGPQPKPGHWG